MQAGRTNRKKAETLVFIEVFSLSWIPAVGEYYDDGVIDNLLEMDLITA